MAKRSIEKNYIYNLSYQLLAMIVILISTPYLSRVLGTTGVGIFSYTYSIVTYFILIGSLGITMYGQREIAYVQDNIKKRSIVFFQLFLLKTITLLISIIIFSLLFWNSKKYGIYFRILDIELIANIFDITWFFQGLEDFKKIVIRNGIVKIITLLLMFAFIKNSNDLSLYFFIYTLSTLIGNISLWVNIKGYIKKITKKELDFVNFLKKHYKAILILLIPQISVQIYTVLDKTMIGLMISDIAEVGFYERAQNIVKLALTVITSFGTIMFSRISYSFINKDTKKLNEYIDKSFDFVWLIAIPIMFGLCAIAPNLVPWYLGNDYYPVIRLIQYSCPLIVIIGTSQVIFSQYLISTNKNNLYTKSVLIGAICNVTMNLIFIKFFMTSGAVLSSVLSEFIILIVEIILVKNNIKYIDNFINSIKYFICGFIMFCIVTITGKYLSPSILNTFILVVIGVIVYFTLLVIIKEKNIIKIIQKILKKNERSEN